MSKRRLSPAPLPPPKRLHTSTANVQSSTSGLTFDSALYDELILFIFSHLSWLDLCSIQATNRNWARLSTDNELWRSLYLREYGRSRLRGARGFIGRMDGREVKPLPGRVKTGEIKDWKWMFRISSNWRTGRCTVQHLDSPTPETAPAETYILLAGALTITATSTLSSTPKISLCSPSAPSHSLSVCSLRNNTPASITALALDQSPPTSPQILQLASFLSTGEFVIFSLNHTKPSLSTRRITHIPPLQTARTAPIIQAVYHHPMLITLSEAFHLSIYEIDTEAHHQQTLTSFTSFPPSSLVLSTPTSTTYKLVMTYAIPVYPAHWSVGATELILSVGGGGVQGSRSTRTFVAENGWVDEKMLKSMREQWGRKVGRVVDCQTDGKWAVLAPGRGAPTTTSIPPPSHVSSSSSSPTSLQLYRLSFSPSITPRLTFIRTLHGHAGDIEALSVADGRCVSLGRDGSVWVWDLEGGVGAEVTSGKSLEIVGDEWNGRGTVVFDERRVVSAGGRSGGVVIRRFDV